MLSSTTNLQEDTSTGLTSPIYHRELNGEDGICVGGIGDSAKLFTGQISLPTGNQTQLQFQGRICLLVCRKLWYHKNYSLMILMIYYFVDQ